MISMSEAYTRIEQYLRGIASGTTEGIPSEPYTRIEQYLDYIANNGGGGGGTSDYTDLDNKPAINSVTLVGNKTFADLGLADIYIIKGSCAFADLPDTLTLSMSGYVYDITDDFTTTADFVGGAGKKYPAGTNIVIANTGTPELPVMKFDVIGSFVNVDEINGRIDSISDDITPNVFAAENAYAIGDIVMHNDRLYKFKAAHTANTAWSAAEVDEINIINLINSVNANFTNYYAKTQSDALYVAQSNMVDTVTQQEISDSINNIWE